MSDNFPCLNENLLDLLVIPINVSYYPFTLWKVSTRYTCFKASSFETSSSIVLGYAPLSTRAQTNTAYATICRFYEKPNSYLPRPSHPTMRSFIDLIIWKLHVMLQTTLFEVLASPTDPTKHNLAINATSFSFSHIVADCSSFFFVCVTTLRWATLLASLSCSCSRVRLMGKGSCPTRLLASTIIMPSKTVFRI